MDIPKLVEKIDVRVINVDVVVTDKKGNRVPGLTKDDFLIYENGVPKPISNFYEIGGAAKIGGRSGAPTAQPADAAGPSTEPSRQPAAADHLLHRQPLPGAVQPQPRLHSHEEVHR